MRIRTMVEIASTPSSCLAPKPKSRCLEWLSLAVIWIFYAANITVWEASNKRLIAYDEVGHFFDSVAIFRLLQSPLQLLNVSQFLTQFTTNYPVFLTFNIYPPFVYTVTAFSYFVLPPSLPLASSSSVIFLLVLILSTYGLTNDLLGKRLGLFAAFLVASYPILAGMPRIYYLDFPLTAMVSLSLYLLVRTRDFQNRRTVLLLSLALIAGMLTKQTFPLYVSGPLAYVAFKSVKNRNALRNLILCAAVSAVSIAYYVFFKPGGLAVYLSVYGAEPLLRGDIYQPYAWVRLLEALAEIGMGIPLAILFGAGVYEVVRAVPTRGLILTGLISPIILLAIVEPYYPYGPRFTAPILPLAAVASAAVFINFSRHRRAHVVALILLFTFVMAQYASITYTSPMFAEIHPHAGSLSAYGIGPPSNEDWRIAEILQDLQVDAVTQHISRPSLVVLVYQSSYYFDQTLFYYYAYTDGINVTLLYNGYYSPPAGIQSVCEANYVVTRANTNPDEKSTRITQNVAEVTAFVQNHINDFTLIGTYRLPDGSIASLFRREPSLACAPAQDLVNVDAQLASSTGDY